jgi:methionine-rich copper-binding protein CopC
MVRAGRIGAAALAIALAVGATAPARAHAFLDHASPAVGSQVAAAPPQLTLWFTMAIEPLFSTVTVTDERGARVDLGDAHVAAGHADQLQIGLKRLKPGAYRVKWRVVCTDTHVTEGAFLFRVAGP